LTARQTRRGDIKALSAAVGIAVVLPAACATIGKLRLEHPTYRTPVFLVRYMPAFDGAGLMRGQVDD
jgi:hypothetical protein